MLRRLFNVIRVMVVTIIFFFFILLLILRITIFNQDFFINALEQSNYYTLFQEDFNSHLETFLLSTGFDNELIDYLSFDSEIKKDINEYFNSFYREEEIDLDDIKEIINDRLAFFISDKKIIINNYHDLEEFKNHLFNLYQNNIKYLDFLRKPFYNIYIYLDYLLIAFILLILTIKFRYLPIIFLSSGMLILYFKTYFCEQIDIIHLNIITKSLSKAVNYLLFYDTCLLFVIGNAIMFIGILLSFFQKKG